MIILLFFKIFYYNLYIHAIHRIKVYTIHCRLFSVIQQLSLKDKQILILILSMEANSITSSDILPIQTIKYYVYLACSYLQLH